MFQITTIVSDFIKYNTGIYLQKCEDEIEYFNLHLIFSSMIIYFK